MNWDQLEGKWKELKGSARPEWVGALQLHYGIAKEAADKQADAWWNKHIEAENNHAAQK